VRVLQSIDPLRGGGAERQLTYSCVLTEERLSDPGDAEGGRRLQHR
jgi:hypothetical protein